MVIILNVAFRGGPSHDEQADPRPATHTAGALDIRNIIGGLLGVYGVILTLMGIFGDKENDKTGDVNANLWAGLAHGRHVRDLHRLGAAAADRGARPRRAAGRGRPPH